MALNTPQGGGSNASGGGFAGSLMSALMGTPRLNQRDIEAIPSTLEMLFALSRNTSDPIDIFGSDVVKQGMITSELLQFANTLLRGGLPNEGTQAYTDKMELLSYKYKEDKEFRKHMKVLIDIFAQKSESFEIISDYLSYSPQYSLIRNNYGILKIEGTAIRTDLGLVAKVHWKSASGDNTKAVFLFQLDGSQVNFINYNNSVQKANLDKALNIQGVVLTVDESNIILRRGGYLLYFEGIGERIPMSEFSIVDGGILLSKKVHGIDKGPYRLGTQVKKEYFYPIVDKDFIFTQNPSGGRSEVQSQYNDIHYEGGLVVRWSKKGDTNSIVAYFLMIGGKKVRILNQGETNLENMSFSVALDGTFILRKNGRQSGESDIEDTSFFYDPQGKKVAEVKGECLNTGSGYSTLLRDQLVEAKLLYFRNKTGAMYEYAIHTLNGKKLFSYSGTNLGYCRYNDGTLELRDYNKEVGTLTTISAKESQGKVSRTTKIEQVRIIGGCLIVQAPLPNSKIDLRIYNPNNDGRVTEIFDEDVTGPIEIEPYSNDGVVVYYTDHNGRKRRDERYASGGGRGGYVN